MTAAKLVDWATLGKVVLYSLVAGIGVCIAFSLAVHGATRFADLRRDGRGPEATAFAGLMLAGLAVSVAAVAYGIYLMTQK